MDDGSDVSLMDDLMTYGDNIIYVRQKHAGLSIARNTGIQIAKGKYLQFIDGDDSLIKLSYDYCLDLIRRHQNADMVLFDFSKHNLKSPIPSTKEVSPLSGSDYMRHYNIHGMACGYLFKRTILGDLRFTPGIYHEDEEFTPQLDQLAMERRVAQLTMDYLYNMMMQSPSTERLEETVQTLRAEGLFPLPDRDYTTKYTWFRKLTNSKLGRRILMSTLPLTKRER